LTHIRDFLEEERNFPDILSKKKWIFLNEKQTHENLLYMLVIDIWFQVIVYHDQHNLQEINNLIQVEILHIQINGVNHNIDLN